MCTSEFDKSCSPQTKNHFSLFFSCSMSDLWLVVSGSPAQILSPTFQHTCSHCSLASVLSALRRPCPFPPSLHGIPCHHWQIFLSTSDSRQSVTIIYSTYFEQLLSARPCIRKYMLSSCFWKSSQLLPLLSAVSVCLPTLRTTQLFLSTLLGTMAAMVFLKWLEMLTAVEWVKLGAGGAEEKQC